MVAATLPGMGGRAICFFALVAIVLFGGTSTYHDARPDRAVRPGFTVFAVDEAGAQVPLALFDGRAWRSTCESQAVAGGIRAEAAEGTTSAILGLAGSPGAPLLRVRELTGDSTGWEPTADAVETRALSASDVPSPRRIEPRVYSADAAGTGVAYVEVVVRQREPAFRGVLASAWVVANDPAPAQVIDFHLERFESYPDYLALDRQVPLGIVGEGDQHVWVMKRRSTGREEVRLVTVGPGGARERLTLTGGC